LSVHRRALLRHERPGNLDVPIDGCVVLQEHGAIALYAADYCIHAHLDETSPRIDEGQRLAAFIN
jgi:hypothetical protein